MAIVLLALRDAPDTGPWTSAGVMSWPFRVDFGDGKVVQTYVEMRDNRLFTVAFDDDRVEHLELDADGLLCSNGQQISGATVVDGDTVHLEFDGISVSATEMLQPEAGGSAGASDGRLVAPMPGRIVRVANAGDDVKEGDIIVVLEAMKMEHEITAPFDGTLASVSVEADQQVTGRQTLAQIDMES